MLSTEVRRFADLLEISRILGSTLHVRAAFIRALELLEKHHGAVLGLVALKDAATGEVVVEAATGVQLSAARRGRYRPGEGIIGRVFESGRPIVVPQVSKEPLFLNRMGAFLPSGPEMTFVAVPLTVDSKTVGALGVGHRYQRERHYDQEAKFLAVVASMMGQAVRVHGLGGAPRTGVASVGVRPTVSASGVPLLEVFIFDFDDTIYGRRVGVEFVHKLRDEERYSDLGALTNQIRTDVAQARDYFSTACAQKP